MLAPQSGLQPRRLEAPSLGKLNGHRVLLLILATALVLRGLCGILFNGEIDTEGTEYARIAENILLGRGYVGMATEGVQLVFPPLFPLLIAGVSMLIGDPETAGRTLNVIFGALLVLPVYGIAGRLFNENVGLGAAALVAVHPYLVNLSTTVYCEPTYLTLLLAAVFAAMAASDRSDGRMLAAAGFFYGLAYLVRPEAAIFMLIGAVCFLLQRALVNRGFFGMAAREVRLVGLMIASFVLVAGPYIVWLSQQTGEFTLQTKDQFNIPIELRIQQGMPNYAASFAISPELVAEGIWMQPNIDVIKGSRLGVNDYVSIFTKRSKDLLREISKTIAGSLEFGSPALFALAVLGLFGWPWRPRNTIDQLHLLLLLLLTALAQFFIFYWSLRYYQLFLVVFCIWASAGLPCLLRWARQTVLAWGHAEPAQTRVVRVAAAIALAALLAPAGLFAVGNMLWTRGSRPIEALSTRLGADSVALKIADTSTPFAFHAGAQFVWLPYSDEGTALKYLATKQVTHVVLRSEIQDGPSYVRSWMQHGVPGAQLVGEARSTRGDLVQVFQLKPSAAP
jgi:4-amino-4-deoxy-L-arabinose transferase-like glycosyltransferase